MERMMGIGMAPSVGKFRTEQIAQQQTWTKVPEDKRIESSMNLVHIVPTNSSTCTYVNPLDPGNDCYYDSPKSWDRVPRTWRM